MSNRKIRKARGAALIEYSIMLLAVTVVSISGLKYFGKETRCSLNYSNLVLRYPHAESYDPYNEYLGVCLGGGTDGAIEGEP